MSQDWLTIPRTAVQQKHQKYGKAAEAVRGSFTLLMCSAGWASYKENSWFQKRFSDYLARKWSEPYSKIKEWVCGQSLTGLKLNNSCSFLTLARNVKEDQKLYFFQMESNYHIHKFKFKHTLELTDLVFNISFKKIVIALIIKTIHMKSWLNLQNNLYEVVQWRTKLEREADPSCWIQFGTCSELTAVILCGPEFPRELIQSSCILSTHVVISLQQPGRHTYTASVALFYRIPLKHTLYVPFWKHQ